MSEAKIPKLPAPDVMCDCGANLFTAEQMRAFALHARMDALEEAAKAVEERAGTVSMFANSREARDHNATIRGCAAAIRELSKEKDHG